MIEIMKNKKVLYALTALIVILGIISIFVFKLNYTLMYSEHTKISVYLGKEYNLQDIKNVVEETLGKQEVIYQEIEVFKDSIAINIKSANEEQIKALETKLREKYEIGENEEFIVTEVMGHIRGRDIVKPYIIPMIIVTIVIIAYIGVRYLNLGLLKVITTLILRLIISQALFLSVIAIIRIPIGVYTVPLAILIYIAVVTYTVVQNENRLEKNKENDKKK